MRYEFDQHHRIVAAWREDDEPFEHERALLALSGGPGPGGVLPAGADPGGLVSDDGQPA